jgi:capsule biosynthesis phosphatase
MKYILLCGGIGKRCQYSLPKPLNYVQGKHLIEYIIESIPSDEIYIIYNEALDQYNFRQIVLNKFKLRTFYFSSVSFLTRGAVETALIGIKKMPTEQLNNGEPIVFIDNDNIHTFPVFDSDINTHFICYGHDYQKTNYSFIQINEQNIIDNIEEKIKISDCFCCGLYGFKDAQSFIEIANQLIELNMKTKQEFYFSQLYKLLIQKGEPILPIYVNETKHLGTFKEIEKSPIISAKKMRICFDLDNTLVTYPETPGDYSTVKPIKKMIDLLHFFKKQGHEIIIYTARRMETHKSNVGKVIKDIAIVTFSTLEKFGIEYDEIIFGKPIADIYIDDRAMNPYYNDISLFGFFGHYKEFIPNKIENNKYNKMEKLENQIKKIGPEKFMRGELFFYQNIPKEVSHYFPNLLSFCQHENTNEIEINIDFINGIPLYFLYANQTLTTNIIDKCFEFLHTIHNQPFPEITVSFDKIKSNYFDKLKQRFENNAIDYPFVNSHEIFGEILENLEKYYEPKLASIIHGDFWFSNILLNYSNDELICIDMKGQVDGELTLNGDIYYDYGKMYQSILGYDLILNKQSVSEEYLQKNKMYFLKKCQQIHLNLDYLHWVTKSLIFGTFYFNSENVCKNEIWEWMNTRL